MSKHERTPAVRPIVLVTGGNGFVAGWVIVGLLRRGYAVRATLRSLTKAETVRTAVARAGAPTEHLTFLTADLTRDDGWDDAMTGVTYVLHVASPLGNQQAAHPDELITPARDGTLRILKAALKGNVARIVMTSSAAAATPTHHADSQPVTEEVWTDPQGPNLTPYRLSKILAERAAWDYMEAHGSAHRLTTILPGSIFGPALMRDSVSSLQILERLLQGRPPLLARLGLSIVDVRDLADTHIEAMTASEAAGQRFLVAGEFRWLDEVARLLRDHLGSAGARVPTRRLPNAAVRLLARVNPELRALAPLIGRTLRFNSQKAVQTLNYAPRPVLDTVLDSARSLIELNRSQ